MRRDHRGRGAAQGLSRALATHLAPNPARVASLRSRQRGSVRRPRRTCGGGDSVPGLIDPQARLRCRELYVLAPGRTHPLPSSHLSCCRPSRRRGWPGTKQPTKPVVYVDAMGHAGTPVSDGMRSGPTYGAALLNCTGLSAATICTGSAIPGVLGPPRGSGSRGEKATSPSRLRT